jgi:hypothetical protein
MSDESLSKVIDACNATRIVAMFQRTMENVVLREADTSNGMNMPSTLRKIVHMPGVDMCVAEHGCWIRPSMAKYVSASEKKTITLMCGHSSCDAKVCEWQQTEKELCEDPIAVLNHAHAAARDYAASQLGVEFFWLETSPVTVNEKEVH